MAEQNGLIPSRFQGRPYTSFNSEGKIKTFSEKELSLLIIDFHRELLKDAL